MTPPQPGDRVHVAGFGSGVVQEIRNGGRCVVAIKGRAMVVSASQLSLAPAAAKGRATPPVEEAPREESSRRAGTLSLDLHGHTVEAAMEALDRFVSDALLAGAEHAVVIHGRSGGRIKAAVHARLKEVPSVKRFFLDPRNAGVTLMVF
ncbi:MAG: Smr/MutS family protein [Vicinamibacterales bacterium]